MESRKQGLTLFTAACVLIGMLVVIQLWLLSASLDDSGDGATSARAALASFVLFVVNAALLRFALGFDRRLRRLVDR